MKKESKLFAIVSIMVIGIVIIINFMINGSLERTAVNNQERQPIKESETKRQGLKMEEEQPQGEYDKPLAPGEPLLN